MAGPIGNVRFGEIQPIEMPRPAQAPAADGGVDFAKTLTDAMGDAGNAEKAAGEASEKFAKGDPSVGIHEVMIAAEKATVAVRYAVTLKNKVLEAYRELMQTPL